VTHEPLNFCFRVEIAKGSPLNTPTDPHLLAFEHWIDHVGQFRSAEVQMYRDGIRADDVIFCTFGLAERSERTLIKFQYKDLKHSLVEHDYALQVQIHYLD
jgi:hypothetical protein